jgi:hypothetical protein
MKPIPRREPEIVQAEADRLYRGDTDRVPTTSLRGLTFRGVDVSSRYHQADELEAMLKMIATLPRHIAAELRSLQCNSKATHSFHVELRRWNAHLATEVGWRLAIAAGKIPGGHNGIDVWAGD